jgi:hypothetical protein
MNQDSEIAALGEWGQTDDSGPFLCMSYHGWSGTCRVFGGRSEETRRREISLPRECTPPFEVMELSLRVWVERKKVWGQSEKYSYWQAVTVRCQLCIVRNELNP